MAWVERILTRQAMQPTEQSFERLKQFAADAAHELRSPLMVIATNVEVALSYPDGNRSKGDTEKFEAIASATSQMTCLTEGLFNRRKTAWLYACGCKPVFLGSVELPKNTIFVATNRYPFLVSLDS